MTPQPMEALKKAEATRLHASEMRLRIKRGEARLGDALRDPMLQGIRLGKMMCWERQVQLAVAAKMLDAVGVGRSFLERPVRDLTERQRRELEWLAECQAKRRENGRSAPSRWSNVYVADLEMLRNGDGR